MSDQRDETGNLVRIRGEGFELEIKGEAEFIHNTYAAVRGELLSRFIRAVAADMLAPDPPSVDQASASGSAPGGGDGPTFAQVAPSAAYVWICVCHDYYHKIHLINRGEFHRTPLASVVDPTRLFRLYIEREHREKVETMVDLGRMLWSELTEEGQRRLGSGA